MTDNRQELDPQTRRRIRWTVAVLVLIAFGFYVWSFVRQMNG